MTSLSSAAVNNAIASAVASSSTTGTVVNNNGLAINEVNKNLTLSYLRLLNLQAVKGIRVVPLDEWTDPWFELPENFVDPALTKEYQIRLFNFAQMVQSIGIGHTIFVLAQHYRPSFLAASQGGLGSTTRSVYGYRDVNTGLVVPGLERWTGVRDPVTGTLSQRIRIKSPEEPQDEPVAAEPQLTTAQKVIRGTVQFTQAVPIVGQVAGLLGGLLELLPGVARQEDPVTTPKPVPVNIDAELFETILTQYTYMNITVALHRPNVYGMSLIGNRAQSFSDNAVVQDALGLILGISSLAELVSIFNQAFPETSLNRTVIEMNIRIQFEPDIIIALQVNGLSRPIVVLPKNNN